MESFAFFSHFTTWDLFFRVLEYFSVPLLLIGLLTLRGVMMRDRPLGKKKLLVLFLLILLLLAPIACGNPQSGSPSNGGHRSTSTNSGCGNSNCSPAAP
jgi:hypothetical protein